MIAVTALSPRNTALISVMGLSFTGDTGDHQLIVATTVRSKAKLHNKALQ